MINLKSAQLLIGGITFFIAYLIAVTLAGSFRAWVAKKMGDSTADDAGFLTLNPLMHIDFFGLFFLFLFYFGWGRHIPINIFNITGKWRNIKIGLAYFSDTIAHIVLAFSALIILLVLFDENILHITRYMILSGDMSHLYIAHIYPTYPSFLVSIAFILIALMYLNVVLGVLNLLVNGCNLFMVIAAERSGGYMAYNYYTVILIPILLIWFFSGPLRLLVVNLIMYSGYFIAHLLGIA